MLIAVLFMLVSAKNVLTLPIFKLAPFNSSLKCVCRAAISSELQWLNFPERIKENNKDKHTHIYIYCSQIRKEISLSQEIPE